MSTLDINIKTIGCVDYEGINIQFKGNGFECRIIGPIDNVLTALALIMIERGVECSLEGFTQTTLSRDDLAKIDKLLPHVKNIVSQEILKLLGYYQLLNDKRLKYLTLWNILEILSSEKMPELSLSSRVRRLIIQFLEIREGKRKIIKNLFTKRGRLNIEDKDLEILRKVIVSLFRKLLSL